MAGTIELSGPDLAIETIPSGVGRQATSPSSAISTASPWSWSAPPTGSGRWAGGARTMGARSAKGSATAAAPLPVAPRLVRRHHRRGGRGPCAQSDPGVPGRRARRADHRGRSRRSRHPGTNAAGRAVVGGDRRRRGGGRHRRRDPAPARLPRAGDADRRRAARRPAQPVQGLPGRHAPEDWLWLRGTSFYADHDIDLVSDRRVVAIDPSARTVELDDGRSLEYGALLLAPGAEPIRPPIPESPQVHYLRSLDDSRAIVEATGSATTAVVVGAGFIGLEVAASLRARDLDVTVVAPEPIPLAHIIGDEMGSFVRSLHEEHGVVFQLGHVVREVKPGEVVLDDGTVLPAELVVIGVGVRPRTRARRGGRARGRQGHRGRRPVAYQRSVHLGGRRLGPLSPPRRRQHPRRALGAGAAAGAGRRRQHPRARHPVHHTSVLLEPALRHPDQRHRARRRVGRSRGERRPGRSRRDRRVPKERGR